MDKNVQKAALAVTRWVGSPLSLIVHSLLFIGSFLSVTAGLIEFDKMLLVLTTIVSLEAIYLSIFIQMTINYQGQSIEEVSEDIEEIHEHMDDIHEDVGEIQENVEELQEDVEEISEDVEEMAEGDAEEEAAADEQERALSAIQSDLQKLLADVERLKNSGPKQG